jgi:hypothetical protein
MRSDTQVVAAARALSFLAKLKPRVRCLTVHSDGCKDFKDNPETPPVRKSKAAPPSQPGEVRAWVRVWLVAPLAHCVLNVSP